VLQGRSPESADVRNLGKVLNLKGVGSDISGKWAILEPRPRPEAVPTAQGQSYLIVVVDMPLLRYFSFVGGTLLALLFVASWYFPEAETISRSEVARPVIRIASDRVGPPRVDFDTRLQAAAIPVSVPDAVSVPDVGQQAPALVAQATPVAPPRMPAAAVKVERAKTRVAKRPDRQRVAANSQRFQPYRPTWWPL
jgi:hypothetical protein